MSSENSGIMACPCCLDKRARLVSENYVPQCSKAKGLTLDLIMAARSLSANRLVIFYSFPSLRLLFVDRECD